MSVLDNLFNSSIGSGQISFISPTQLKEHPLDQLSLVSHVTSLGFDQPDSTGQSTTPKSRLLSLPKTGKPPGPCCFLDPNRLIPHSHSSRPSVTYLDLAKTNEWFLGIPLEFLGNSFGIPLDPNYTKLSFRWFQPLFSDVSARFLKDDHFFTSGSSHTYKHQAVRTLRIRRSFTKMKDKASMKIFLPTFEWFWFKSLWKKNPQWNHQKSPFWKKHFGNQTIFILVKLHQSAQVWGACKLEEMNEPTHETIPTRMIPTQHHKTRKLIANWKLCFRNLSFISFEQNVNSSWSGLIT